MGTNKKRYGQGFAMRLLIASLAFIIGLAAHSLWDDHHRINELIRDFIANYQD